MAATNNTKSNITLGCRLKTHEMENCREKTQLCKQNDAQREVLLNDVKGLADECRSLSEDLGIPNVVYMSQEEHY